MAVESMLTTTDNPYDPFEQYEEWFRFDSEKGYNTPSYLAHLVAQGYELSETDQRLAIDLAIEEIVSVNLNGMYKRVVREVEEKNLE